MDHIDEMESRCSLLRIQIGVDAERQNQASHKDT